MHIPDGISKQRDQCRHLCHLGGRMCLWSEEVNPKLWRKGVPLMVCDRCFHLPQPRCQFPRCRRDQADIPWGRFFLRPDGSLASPSDYDYCLIVQCLGFADGGLTALGSNLFNMGVVGALGGLRDLFLLYTSSERAEKPSSSPWPSPHWLSIVMGPRLRY